MLKGKVFFLSRCAGKDRDSNSEYEKLYRTPHKDYPDGIHFMDSHHDLGELYITENDTYPYNPDAGRTYRYWGCEAKTKTDERHTHITKWERERATNRK